LIHKRCLGILGGIKNKFLSFEKIFIVGDLMMAAQRGRGLMAPRVGIAAKHQAKFVVSLLMDAEAVVKQIPDLLA